MPKNEGRCERGSDGMGLYQRENTTRYVDRALEKKPFMVAEIYLLLFGLVVLTGLVPVFMGYIDEFMMWVLVINMVVVYNIYGYIQRKRASKRGIKPMSRIGKLIHIPFILVIAFYTSLMVNDHIRYAKLTYTVQSHAKEIMVVNRCTDLSKEVIRCVSNRPKTLVVYSIVGNEVVQAKEEKRTGKIKR